MAKELPFFKFEPAQWDTGNIQLCSMEVQGVFINVCSIYWQRLGSLPYKLAVQKVCGGNATALDSLIDEGVIKIFDGNLCIDFLNEQLSEFEDTSDQNRKNALEGWKKRRETKDATALQSHSDPNARREDKRREDEIREEKKIIPLRVTVPDIFFGEDVQTAWEEWKVYRAEKKQKLTPSTEKKQMQFLGGRAGPEAIAIINQSITNGWTGLFELKNNGIGNKFKEPVRSTDAIIPQQKSFGIEKGF